MDPSRPIGGSASDVRNKVIGYYESWRAVGDECGLMTPEEIPVEYMDQVNLAFAYIDPKGFNIIAMDDEPMATDLYARVADIKTRNPDAKVWVSVGGWSFNDAGIYQSVFTTIANSRRYSRLFATNLRDFLNKYGFDGVDIDWEYPGADDRGGREDDVVNYPGMLETIREYLTEDNIYGKKWGISITVPTSYWYLRWFDVKKLESVVDEFNLMAYDLHGTWDRDDPIGPYVYAHTNLTEITEALDLFWRNDIDPSKINLGLAFYGRTFELSTPLCATAGCEWKGPAPKGDCTGTAGILSYREIQAIVAQSDISPHYDEDAGVYSITYGKGGAYWASFDDTISFEAKIDLANKYGLGGVLIWAIDQDDDYFHALKGVTGKDVEPVPLATDGFGAFMLDQCYITDCGETCNAGDVTMTKLNEDDSGRGCPVCCPAVNAPDSSTCYWTGGPINCHGQCAAGEVTMVLDDYGDSGKRCSNGGKKAWCCPATNGQAAIQECGLAAVNEDCPSDKPQEMTAVYWYADISDLGTGSYRQKFCCPEKPEYDIDQCGWHGENYYCNDSECPIGQVELFRWKGSHAGPPKSSSGCNKGRQQAFCCPPPLSNGSAFLPVPLENLFPTADSFSDSFTSTFALAVDNSPDETSASVDGTDPNKHAFIWTIMVGEEEDVQSFDKRDGSHLELFDCPMTRPDDFGIQKAKAVCIGGTDSKNNCEDIFKGGVEGTIVRLPSHCGPDDYVRAVHFARSANFSLPSNLQKRHPSANKVYEFHYDYNFKNLRRDGGEIYFRADLSTHPGYWDKVVAAAPGSSVKRSADNWRQLDRRFWAESDKESWLKRFNDLLTQGNTGLKKHYEFNQCLFEGNAACGNVEAIASAFVYGELNTTMDFGTTFIGTLRNFQFSEAFSFFNQEGFAMRAGAGFQAKARLYFDSDWIPIGSFDAFGMDLGLKGVFSIKPYFAVDARLEADAYVSTQATVQMAISHERFRYYLPDDLGNNPTSVTGSFNLDGLSGPISGLGDIDAKAGGGLVFGFRPTIGMDINLQLRGEQYVNTSVKLSTPGSIRFDTSLALSCTNGLQVDVTGQMDVDFSVSNAIPGWSSKSYTFKDNPVKTIYSDCVPFDAFLKRSLRNNTTALEARAVNGADFPIPVRSSSTCAFSTQGIYCADPGANDDPKPNCDLRDLSDLGDDEASDDNDNEAALARRRLLQKRSTKRLAYCVGLTDDEGKGYKGFGPGSRGTISFTNYPSSTELVTDYYPDAATYDNEDYTDCNNYNLIKLAQTPKRPTDASANNGRTYHSEHVLEGQTVQRFFNYAGKLWSTRKDGPKAPNPRAREYSNPSRGRTDELPWCTWMKSWWDGAGGFSANNALGGVFPGYHWWHTDEFVLYESVLNSGIKQAWFGAKALKGKKELSNLMDKREWASVAKIFKLHILAWKYYYFDDVKLTLVKQANRVEAKLRELDEQGVIQQKVGARYDKAYIPQGLANLWSVWVEEEHERVQLQVKDFLQEYAQKAYDLNRPPSSDGTINPGEAVQSNPDIVKMFEIALSEVNNLQPWDIDWDMDTGDDNDGMDTDSD
ncbi:CAZyme family GH18 [Paecilomyces variotii]|nr:CAZyme family GH18 [Paecilomyces variotii]KAJ9237256.1 CAZyme family GH18 [Paecilomyces variotii]KAJ9300429.1 CAZyme family GH18 [Paecilomyces variotii]